MIRSANEVAAQVLKAARGAGLPLGVAEDLAQIAPGLAPDGLEMLAAALDSKAAHGDLCALCHWRDFGGGSAFSPQNPALAALAGAEGPEGAREVPGPVWQRLDALARLTCVPASAASRDAGAGAGDIDND